METSKVTLKIVRSFSVGFTIYSPKYNGLCFDVQLACFVAMFWWRGKKLFSFESYWNA